MRTMMIMMALSTTTAVAHATTAAEKVTGALQAMKQNAEHLEGVLVRRNMPRSIVKTPEKVVRAAERDLRPRLLEGITSEPTLNQSGRSIMLEVNGNRTSQIESTVRLSSDVGTQERRVAAQFIQATNETITQSVPRDPRIGLRASNDSVMQWKTKGRPTQQLDNYRRVVATLVNGPAKVRTVTPLSPGLKFRDGRLEPGSSLVMVQGGATAQLSFNNDGVLTEARGTPVSRTYLLKAHEDGHLKAVRLTAQEITDLRANTPFSSYKLNHEGTEMEPNHAKGYSPEALKESGF